MVNMKHMKTSRENLQFKQVEMIDLILKYVWNTFKNNQWS